MYKGYCKIQMVIFSRLLHVKVKLRVSTSFSQFSEGKNKVDAVLNFDLLYKDVLIPKIIVQMCFIIQFTYYKTCQYLIIR